MKDPKRSKAHPPGIRAFGPITIGSQMSLIAPKRGRSAIRHLDVGPYRGQTIEVSRIAAGLLLSLNFNAIENLVQLGALKEAANRTGRANRYVLVDPAWSAAEVYDAWANERPMPVHHADFVPFEKMRSWCRVSDDHPYPPLFLEGLFQKLAEMGNFSDVEVRVFLSLNRARWNVVKSWLDGRLGKFCLDRSRTEQVTLEMFRRSLPAPFQTAPRTCFEPVDRTTGGGGQRYLESWTEHSGAEGAEVEAQDLDHEVEQAGVGHREINSGREAPSAAARRIVWNMSELFLTGSLYALIAAPALRRTKQVDLHLANLAKVEAIMRLHAPEKEWTIDVYADALRAYAIDETIIPGELPAVRYETVRMFRIIIGRLHIYLRQQPKSFSGAVLPLVAPRVRLSLSFRTELRQKYASLRVAGRENRKKVSHKAMDELALIIDAAKNRRDEMRGLGQAVRLEIQAFGKDEAFRETGVKLPVLDERGGLAGGEQKVWLRVWRCREAALSLGRESLEDGVLRWPEYRRIGAPAVVRPKFIVEVLDTLPVGTSRTRQPWMLELDRIGVFASFSRASPDLKELRHRTIVDRGLPGHTGTAAGTLNFDIWRSSIRRFGLEAGRHFAPIEQQEYGIRLAFHALDCVQQSYNRAHEVRQQVRNGWKPLDLPAELLSIEREQWFRQDVIGKVPRWSDLAEMAPIPIGIRETSYIEALAITELHKLHAGLKKFPTMAPPNDFKWKCGPGQYVFSSFGRTLTLGQLQVPLWYLLDGWDDYLLHDFRHSAAEDSALDGYSTKLIAFLLGQKDVETTLYYSQLDAWAQEIVDKERQRRREEQQDRCDINTEDEV